MGRIISTNQRDICLDYIIRLRLERSEAIIRPEIRAPSMPLQGDSAPRVPACPFRFATGVLREGKGLSKKKL
jgi:hypothetical protein